MAVVVASMIMDETIATGVCARLLLAESPALRSAGSIAKVLHATTGTEHRRIVSADAPIGQQCPGLSHCRALCLRSLRAHLKEGNSPEITCCAGESITCPLPLIAFTRLDTRSNKTIMNLHNPFKAFGALLRVCAVLARLIRSRFRAINFNLYADRRAIDATACNPRHRSAGTIWCSRFSLHRTFSLVWQRVRV